MDSFLMIKSEKKSSINNKIVIMLNIVLETRTEELKLWNEKLLKDKRASRLLIYLRTVESMIGEGRFTDALM
jgi:hypothetical protein